MVHGYSQIVDWIVREAGQREVYVNIKASVWDFLCAWGLPRCLIEIDSIDNSTEFSRYLSPSLTLSISSLFPFTCCYLICCLFFWRSFPSKCKNKQKHVRDNQTDKGREPKRVRERHREGDTETARRLEHNELPFYQFFSFLLVCFANLFSNMM